MELQETSYEIWEQKYQLKDAHGNPVDKSIHDMNARVSKSIAKQEDDSEFWEKRFMWALENGATPAGRIMSNAGAEHHKPATSLINCTVSQTIGDSMLSIMDGVKQSGLTLKAGCGIGYEFSTLRPKGAYVGGAGATTSGAIPFMDIYDKMCFTVSSAGGRRGAQMGTFAVWHPDVKEFISAKREDGRLRQFNLSLLIDDEFINAVKSDSEYNLIFPITKKEKEIFKYKDSQVIFKDLFWEEDYCNNQNYIIEEGKILCKIYETIKAMDLWNLIMQSTYDYAEPGFLLIDQINKMNNNSFCETIRATNPCQPSFATLLTPEGIKTFADINIGDKIWSGDKWTNIVNKWSTGVKKVYEYQTTRGRFIGTENHRIVESGEKIEVGMADGIDLSLGDELSNVIINPQDVMDGLVVGDGFKHKASNDKIILCIGRNDHDYFDSDVSNLIGNNSSIKREYGYEIKTTITGDELPLTFDRIIPDRFYFGDSCKKAGFLRGLFSANGSVVADGGRITLKGSSKKLIVMASEMLSSLGIPSYITTNRSKNVEFDNGIYRCKESYDLNITAKRDLFYKEIGFIQKYKMDKIKVNRTEVKYKTSSIKSIEYIGEMEVFDINVEDEKHTYWTGGCLVSNCGEQPLPPEGSCLLGSINLAKLVVDPFTEEAKFDWNKYKLLVRIFSRMLDNVVEMNGLPLDGQVREIESKRRHGMGFLGLGSTMSLLGMKYGSEESILFTEKVMKIMAIESYREGALLAKDKGPAPILNDDGNFKSWMDGDYISRLCKEDAELKALLMKNKCRYTHATSIAPTGTISLSLNNNASNGIEPTFAHKYTRNVIKEGKNVKQAVDVYSYEMLLYKEVTGSEEIPESFSTSDSVSTKQHVDIQAAAQKWCDSSISKTINVPTDLPFDEFKDVYLYAYDNGLKGCTTFRFNPEAFQGVLVKDDDLENTEYEFVLSDGSVHSLKGNDIVEYKGESQTAANLYDGLKEGYFGKF